MKQKHIVACSGGFQRTKRGLVMGPIVQYILGLTDKERPKLCYVGTATGDSAHHLALFYSACIGQSVEASHLQLFPMPNVEDIRSFLLAQDVIWVDGGSVANLLAVWKVHGLDKILREAWEQGVILSGSSAGSICWHEGGVVDSFGPELRYVANGLRLLPYANGVHFDRDAQRRPLLRKLIAEGVLGEGYAADDGVALHYVGAQLHKVIADVPEKFAYHIIKSRSGVKETRLDTELLR